MFNEEDASEVVLDDTRARNLCGLPPDATARTRRELFLVDHWHLNYHFMIPFHDY